MTTTATLDVKPGDIWVGGTGEKVEVFAASKTHVRGAFCEGEILHRFSFDVDVETFLDWACSSDVPNHPPPPGYGLIERPTNSTPPTPNARRAGDDDGIYQPLCNTGDDMAQRFCQAANRVGPLL